MVGSPPADGEPDTKVDDGATATTPTANTGIFKGSTTIQSFTMLQLPPAERIHISVLYVSEWPSFCEDAAAAITCHAKQTYTYSGTQVVEIYTDIDITIEI